MEGEPEKRPTTAASESSVEARIHALEIGLIAQEHRLISIVRNLLSGWSDVEKREAALISLVSWAVSSRKTIMTISLVGIVGGLAASIIALWQVFLMQTSVDEMKEQTRQMRHQTEHLQAQQKTAERLDNLKILYTLDLPEALRSAALDKLDLSTLERSALKGYSFDNFRMNGKDLSDRNLSRSTFSGAQMDDTSFANSLLNEAVFRGCKGDSCRAVYDPTRSYRTVFDHGLALKMKLEGPQLINASFVGAELVQPQFSGGRLDWSSFAFSKVMGAKVPKTSEPDESPDFAATNLVGTNWFHAHLDSVKLLGLHARIASWEESYLTHVSFEASQLMGATFACAALENTTFDQVDLDRVSFEGARLQQVSFRKASAEVIDFRGATIRDSDFTGLVASDRSEPGKRPVFYLEGARFENTKIPEDFWKVSCIDGETRSSAGIPAGVDTCDRKGPDYRYCEGLFPFETFADQTRLVCRDTLQPVRKQCLGLFHYKLQKEVETKRGTPLVDEVLATIGDLPSPRQVTLGSIVPPVVRHASGGGVDENQQRVDNLIRLAREHGFVVTKDLPMRQQ